MNRKKKVLVFIDWYYPAYKAGGPVQSITNFVEKFKGEFDISIITSDRDLGDTVSFSSIVFNSWVPKDGYRVMYLTPEMQRFSVYKKIMLDDIYDVTYLNGLFSLSFSLKPLIVARLLGKEIVLAPRGMLGKGALDIKPVKKNIFLSLTRIIGLYKNVRWHATAETELAEIKKYIGKSADVVLAPNIPSARLEENYRRDKKKNALTLFFLSRISEKKNLLFAIDVLKRVDALFSVELHVIGPVDDENYWNKCKESIRNLPQHINVIEHGAVPNNALGNYLEKCHFLLLPTFHENYGHAIVESLQYGCPIIISDNTPWRQLSNPAHGVGKIGWDISLHEPDLFAKVIENCARMSQEEYLLMSEEAFRFSKIVIQDENVVEANRVLFCKT